MRFQEWLKQEIEKRGWTQNELARIAGTTSAQVSRVMTESRNPGPEFCQQIARALKLPEEEIFLRAGLLGSPLSRLFVELSPEQQEIILAEMRRMVEENERSTARGSFRTAPNRI